MPSAAVLVIVPTLGRRLDSLVEALRSISNQDIDVDVVIVSPRTAAVGQIADLFGAQLMDDPGSQAAAINAGVTQLKSHHEWVSWLNDDDLLESNSLHTTRQALESNPRAVLAYGACRYIDEDGRQLWVSRAGAWASRVLKWGPDLIPQPGMLIRSQAWTAVGGVDESLRFAFDLDLLLKLKALGEFVSVPDIVASFRWHDDSLTVADRSASLRESEMVKRRALTPRVRRFAWAWERPVRIATHIAAAEVSRRARRHSSH